MRISRKLPLPLGSIALLVLFAAAPDGAFAGGKKAQAPPDFTGTAWRLEELSRQCLKGMPCTNVDAITTLEILPAGRFRIENPLDGGELAGELLARGKKGTSFEVIYSDDALDRLEKEIAEVAARLIDLRHGPHPVEEVTILKSKVKAKVKNSRKKGTSIQLKESHLYEAFVPTLPAAEKKGGLVRGKFKSKSIGTPSGNILTIYVSGTGDDAFQGTPENPKRTIQAGIDRAILELGSAGIDTVNVAVAEGTYRETVELAGGVNLLGGFCGDFLEQDPGLYTSAILGNPALFAKGVRGEVEVRGFRIEGIDGSAPGESSIAVVLIDSPWVALAGDVIAAGNGAAGTAGAPGVDGVEGMPGDPGEGVNTPVNMPGDPGLGGDSACGPTAGRGGRGASPGQDGASGQNGPGGGGSGGAGGKEGKCIEYTCKHQLTGSILCSGYRDLEEAADCGFLGKVVCLSTCEVEALPGGKGDDGAAGAAGAGAADPLGMVFKGDWVGEPGAGGEPGGAGKPGGGGGGGGGLTETIVIENIPRTRRIAGGGGGGGGGCGCGGEGGEGGRAGGGSLGIFIIGGSPRLEDILIEAGVGGAGGTGGDGGPGGAGGAGGAGGEHVQEPYRAGAVGGPGGRGGPGGPGGGGAGGISFGIYLHAGTKVDLEDVQVIEGTGGPGGEGGRGGNRGVDGAAGKAFPSP